MAEWQLFEPGTIPEWTTAAWYECRERAPHIDQVEHRGRLLLARDMVGHAVSTLDPAPLSLVDLGAGDGGLLSLVRAWDYAGSLKAWGYDLQRSNVDPAVAERGVDVRYGDVVAGEIAWGDVAVATEMLEHLVDPHAFVRRIAVHCRALVASSPFTERPGTAYGFHTWCWDEAGYRSLLEQAGFRVVRQETTSMFQVLLGVR